MNTRVITGMPNAEYHGSGLITSTHLKRARTPRAYASFLAEPRKVTAAMKRGSLAHEATLEPTLPEDHELDREALYQSTEFAARREALAKTLVLPDGDGRRADVKAAREAVQKLADERGLRTMMPLEYSRELARLERSMNIANAVMSHEIEPGYPLADWLYVPTTHRELSVIIEATAAELCPWHDFGDLADSVLRVGARFDGYNEATRTAFELKTCQSADTHDFGNNVIKSGYDIQLAWYKLLGDYSEIAAVDTTLACAVESAAPHEVQLFRVPAYILEYGRSRIGPRLHNILRALRGDRATLSTGVVDLEIPWIRQ